MRDTSGDPRTPRFRKLGGIAALVAATVAGWVGTAVGQVRVGVELGWHGQAVAAAVNPLTITVENGNRSVLSGVVRAEQRVGSGWRGQVTQRLEAPVVLAPGGRTRLVFPWPVEAGSDPIVVVVTSGGTELASATAPLRLRLEKPVAVVGTGGGPSGRPALVLAPDELPLDPLLLSPFAEVWIGPTEVVPAPARDALRAWAAFGGGKVTGLPVPPAIAPLRDGDVQRGLRDHPPRRAPVGLLIAGAIAYLIAVAYALADLCRRTPPWRAGAVITLSLGFAVFYTVTVDPPQAITAVEYSISSSDVGRLCLVTLGVTAHRAGVWEGGGWWVERVGHGSQRVGREVSWVWGPDGPRTIVELDPGQTMVFERYGPAWPGGGVEEVVGRWGQVPVAERGFAALVGAVAPLVREGDRVFLDSAAQRRGDVAWHVYRLRWDRRG